MRVRRSMFAVLTVMLLALGAVVTSPATAATVAPTVAATPVAGAAFVPRAVTSGGVSRLTVTATNPGTKRLGYVAMGVLIPLGYTVVSRPPGQLCGARPGLFYCVTSVRGGSTSSFVLRVVAPQLPGDYTVSAYARNIDTGNETGATATLTVG